MSNLGRKALFSRADAFRLLEARRLFSEARLTTQQFIDELVVNGELKEPCSLSSMHRLLDGRMFPDLHIFDRDGVTELDTPYPYAEVPKSSSGQPPRPERLDSSGKVMPRLNATQRRLVDEMVRRAEAIGANAAESAIAEFTRQMHKRIDDLEKELYEFGIRRKLEITPVAK